MISSDIGIAERCHVGNRVSLRNHHCHVADRFIHYYSLIHCRLFVIPCEALTEHSLTEHVFVHARRACRSPGRKTAGGGSAGSIWSASWHAFPPTAPASLNGPWTIERSRLTTRLLCLLPLLAYLPEFYGCLLCLVCFLEFYASPQRATRRQIF